jgi:tRNA dimethylallyltransferase
VGKTELSLRIAERLDAEIISADSRQVYRGMDIGTAKVGDEARGRVPHHGLDVVDPGARYSAGRFARDARRWIREIRSRGRVPMIVGGTGFFIRALTDPLFREPPLDRDRREALKAYLAGFEDAALRAWLEALDPDTAAALDARDGGAGRQRVLRALEMALLTGRPLGWWHEHRAAEGEGLDALIFVLSLPRDVLYDRINRRVDAMLEAGLVEEVRGLLDRYRRDAPGMTATGYPEIAGYLAGEGSLEEAADRIRRKTRGYARRQLTWFRNQFPEGTVWLDGTRPTDELVEEVVRRWASS